METTELQMDACVTGYSLEQAWASLRRRHAHECQKFMCAHNEAASHRYQQKLSNTSIAEEMKALAMAVFNDNPDVYHDVPRTKSRTDA